MTDLENLTDAEYDAKLIEGWWQADPTTRGGPPESGAIDLYRYAHDNPQAWPLVDLGGLSPVLARALMVALVAREAKDFDPRDHPRDREGRFAKKPFLPDADQLAQVLGAGTVLADPSRPSHEREHAQRVVDAFNEAVSAGERARELAREREPWEVEMLDALAREDAPPIRDWREGLSPLATEMVGNQLEGMQRLGLRPTDEELAGMIATARRRFPEPDAAERIRAQLDEDPNLTPRTRRVLEAQLEAVFEENYDPNPPDEFGELLDDAPWQERMRARLNDPELSEAAREKLARKFDAYEAQGVEPDEADLDFDVQLAREQFPVGWDRYGRPEVPALIAAQEKAKAAGGKPIGKLKIDPPHRTMTDKGFDQDVADFVVSTFERDDWPGGLTTVVDPDKVMSSTSHLAVVGRIFDKDGVKVGNFARTFEAPGKLLTNDRLELDPHVQGQGFAEAFYRRTEEAAAEQGVEKVQVDADIDVGGYAWAQRGFDWRRRASARSTSEQLRKRIVKMLGDGTMAKWTDRQRAEMGALHDRLLKIGAGSANWDDMPTPKEIANLGRESPWIGHTSGGLEVPMWPGKQLMLGTSWKGVKPIMAGFETKADAADWNRRVMANLDAGAAAFIPGDSYEPHDGATSDLNLLLVDLLLGPDEETK